MEQVPETPRESMITEEDESANLSFAQITREMDPNLIKDLDKRSFARLSDPSSFRDGLSPNRLSPNSLKDMDSEHMPFYEISPSKISVESQKGTVESKLSSGNA